MEIVFNKKKKICEVVIATPKICKVPDVNLAVLENHLVLHGLLKQKRKHITIKL